MNGPLELHPKVVGGTIASSVAVLIIWILSLYRISVPEVAAGALVVVLGAAGGWLAPVCYPAKPDPAPQSAAKS